jgi:hypothetical protein
VQVEAPLDRLPLFVRSGAILPLAPVAQHDGEQAWETITLLIYPDGHSHFDLYEDDGVSTRYQQGHFALTPVVCDSDEGAIQVRIGMATGDAAVVPGNRTYLLQIRAEMPRRVRLDGGDPLPALAGPSEAGAGYWHDDRHFTFVRLQIAAGTVILDY